MITVVRAPAYATVQDAGRYGHRSDGVPPGGAMDWISFRYGNHLVGNPPTAASVEWALSSGEMRFEAGTVFAITGATVDARLSLTASGSGQEGGETIAPNRAYAAPAGAVLTIERIVDGRFVYVCVRGGIDVPPVLGSRSTYLPGSFGGLEGRRLRTGDVLSVGDRMSPRAEAEPVSSVTTERSEMTAEDSSIAVLPGPQTAELGEYMWGALLRGTFTVSPQSDRLGYRLEGGRLPSPPAADRLSEPACPGAIQLTPGGELIVLMVDGPTVGGYPKIGVVASADLPRLAQRVPGESVSFRGIQMGEADVLLSDAIRT